MAAVSRLPTIARAVSRGGYAIRAVILDGSGVTMDPHVLAPAIPFRQSFKYMGLDLSFDKIRDLMGFYKPQQCIEHLKDPEIAAQFQEKFGRAVDPETDGWHIFNTLYAPIQDEMLDHGDAKTGHSYTDLIEGVPEAIELLRSSFFNMKIGMTTGFGDRFMEPIVAAANRQGVTYDAVVTAESIPEAWPLSVGVRPNMGMMMHNAGLLGVGAGHQMIKIDDTTGGIGEGRNVGAWTVALYKDSNYTRINSIAEWHAMTEAEQQDCIQKSKKHLLAHSGAHVVAPDLISAMPAIEHICDMAARGTLPWQVREQIVL